MEVTSEFVSIAEAVLVCQNFKISISENITKLLGFFSKTISFAPVSNSCENKI